MKTMRWMAAIALGALALALAGCGGSDDGSSGGSQSYCEAGCGFAWDCMPESMRPEGNRTAYVAGCAIACEIEKTSSCPDIDEASCKACFTGTCFIPDTACANCNCFLFDSSGQ